MASLQVVGDQVDLDDFCAAERHGFVTCVKQTGNQQACSSQSNTYKACQHHLYVFALSFLFIYGVVALCGGAWCPASHARSISVREVGKVNSCKVALSQFDACRTENSKRDCKDLAKNVYNCYQKL